MRKRNCDKLFDNIMWYTIYLLPIIICIIQSIGVLSNFTLADFIDIENNWYYADFAFGRPLRSALDGFGFSGLRLLSDVYDLFVNLGFMPGDYYGETIFLYFEYFVVVFLGHLLVDFLLFIPRLAHKWLNHAYQGD